MEKSKRKQLKCSHCGKSNPNNDNCFILHPEKRPSSTREKELEAKIGALEEKFKTLASLDQVIDPHIASGAKIGPSTPNYYMHGASGEVMDSMATTRV